MIKDNIVIEGAQLRFKNFSGKAGQFNPEGNRNFCVFLDPEVTEALKQDGWNIKFLQPRDPDEQPQGYIQVAVAYGNIPPKIILISSRGKTLLDEESVKLLDWAEMKEVDLIIRPYNWVLHAGTKNERKGVKAYIKSMYVTLHEDEFEKKYVDVPDSANSAVGGCGECDTCDGSCKCNGD